MNISVVNTLLLADSTAKLSLGERLLTGLPVLIIGMLAVFAVLSILMGVLSLFKIFFYDMPEKKKTSLKEAQEKAKKDSTEVVPVIIGEESEENDTELIAVITAAIAAYNSGKGNALPFRVVSYKRARSAKGWNNGAMDN